MVGSLTSRRKFNHYEEVNYNFKSFYKCISRVV